MAAQGQHYPPHKHPMSQWEIVYYRTGHIHAPIGDELYVCEPGVVLLTPPGFIHAECALTAYSNYWIQVDISPDQHWSRMCRDDAEHSFEWVCGALAQEYNRQSLGRETMLDLLLRQLVILIERNQEHHQISASQRLVRDVEHFFEERYMTRLTMTDVAREIGIAGSTLRAHFAAARGTSPMAVLRAVRVRHAIGLIQNTSLTLEVIATLCGYDSASHLSRYVKQETNKSPGALRRSAAQSRLHD